MKKENQIVIDGHMITVSGIRVNLFNPDPNTILIEDIAHGLAMNCRWNGHTQRFWSVAQHSCMMYDKAPYKERLPYLFHDAEEAYWGDMIKPLKNILRDKCPSILESMKLMRQIIYEKFHISPLTTDCMLADFECLQWEFENITKPSSFAHITVNFWTPEEAKKQWLNRCKQCQ